MEFAIFCEIPVARPWNDRREYDEYHHTLAQAVLADELGYHSFWTVEHHFLEEFSHCSAPGVLYGAVAAKTRNLRIGHGVRLLPFPYNHPLRAAEAAAVLDLISDGRLEFGTGRSATRIELEGFGIQPDQTRSMWDEALRVIVGAWTEDVFSWDGDHFHVPPRRVLPKPLQRPHPPLWVASTSPESHEIAGRKGLGLLSFTIGVPPENLAERLELYRKGLDQAEPVGRSINRTAATFTMVHCAETTDEAIRNARDSFEWYAITGVKQIATLGTWQLELKRDVATYEYTKPIAEHVAEMERVLTFDYLYSSGACIVGDPERCIEMAKRYRAAGCELLLCLMQPWRIPPEKVLKSIELIGRHVIPALR